MIGSMSLGLREILTVAYTILLQTAMLRAQMLWVSTTRSPRVEYIEYM